MSFKNIIIPGVISVALGMFSCSPALFVPTSEEAVSSNIPLDTLLIGRKTYINSCGSCHNLYLPEKYSRIEWDNIITNMQKHSKINDDQISIIKKYLYTKARK